MLKINIAITANFAPTYALGMAVFASDVMTWSEAQALELSEFIGSD